MALKIYTSNSMERLVDGLEKVVRAPRTAPFTPFSKEVIVVQSKGMQRWLSMELASRIGVWANCEFPFPNNIVETIFSHVLPDCPAENSFFKPEVMTWKLMELLQAVSARPGFSEIAGYLVDDRDGLKRMQLAQRIADTFDRYTVYRPELVLSWERGEGTDWQAQLWRELVSGIEQKHRARLLAEFRGAVASANLHQHPRISVIGIPTLPPFHLEVLTRVAEKIEVNLFLLNPCREYWGQIFSEREIAKLEKRGLGPEEWFETGNPLLASWGKLGRDFFESIIDNCGECDRDDTFLDLPADSLLHAIQGDVLDLRGTHTWGRQVPADDRSVLVHSCHSPMREVEVLYDTLLAAFQADPALSPRDVLVMTPDIEKYAPYISAVFDTPEEGGERIPYSIADRSLKCEGEAARALLAILHLCGGRYGVSTVLDVLETPPVARRFAMSDEDLETVRDWLRLSNVRWGIDAQQRAEQGVPQFGDNTWQAGIDRLLLGYAINGEGHSFFNGILPFDDMEGGAVLVLGRFLSFCEKLFSRTRALAKPRGTAAWVETIRELLSDFIQADQDGERELHSLTELAGKLGECGELGGFTGGVGIEVVRYWLETRLGQSERGFGFLTGGVTFCAMLPMRSIPFSVVALIGMDDGAFPRRNRPQGFDLIAREPRRGDRSQRDEDRYLFLEALLSARRRLHISYVGQSLKDNSEMPPSVLVSELVEYAGINFTRPDGTPCSLAVRHPLQPFSPKYFRDDPRSSRDGQLIFSYSRQNFRGAVAKLTPQLLPGPFMTTPLVYPDDDSTVTLKALIDFLCSPAKELLRRRLEVRIEQGVEPLDECEPFCLPTLVKYNLEQEIVAAVLRGEELSAPFAVARGRGDLPPGECGAALFDQLSEPAAEFAAEVAKLSAGEPLAPLDVDIKLPSGRIIGRIGSIRSDRMVLYRYTKMKAKDQLRLWVEHLALNCMNAAGYPRSSTFLAADAAINLSPVEECCELLDQLLALYRQGMGYPVKFFPETSLEYAKKARDPKKAFRALSDARSKWYGSDFYPGECRDDHCRRLFGEDEPLDAEFVETALAVWGPLLDRQSGR
ncbi:exodeoxyribonuclease V subunit gamma [Geomonas sp.]|uniref:exodeoxyribonuclease V subunit gamma n=1 Tax=Geomonas sp. TaxID=2651584 RepID=UPI002B467CA1|nr:exodeoxyribonuclease V subunit gamma [Geomonas sp.]HJV35518.1 exodeoxyribonuclease V subunit gamma [Geomonas sp.]